MTAPTTCSPAMRELVTSLAVAAYQDGVYEHHDGMESNARADHITALCAAIGQLEAERDREKALYAATLNVFAKRIYDGTAASDTTPWESTADREKNHYRMMADSCVHHERINAARSPERTTEGR